MKIMVQTYLMERGFKRTRWGYQFVDRSGKRIGLHGVVIKEGKAFQSPRRHWGKVGFKTEQRAIRAALEWVAQSGIEDATVSLVAPPPEVLRRPWDW